MPLHLTREPGQWIEIGDQITIRVESVRDGRALLAITAPREIPIRRGPEARAQADARNQAAGDKRPT